MASKGTEAVAEGRDDETIFKGASCIGEIVTQAPARATGLTMLAAVTNTACGLLTWGALNRPVDEIVPELADQLTAVSADSRTAAVNCNVPPEVSVASNGATSILIRLIGGPGGSMGTMRNPFADLATGEGVPACKD